MSSGVFKVLYTCRGRLYICVNVNVKTCILQSSPCFSHQISDQLNEIVVIFVCSHTRVLEIEYTLKQTCLCVCFAVGSGLGHSCGLSPNVSVSASFLAVHFSIHTSRFIRLFTQ
jgi:hypothetical protein